MNNTLTSTDIHLRHLFARRLAREAGDLILSLRYPSTTTTNTSSLNIDSKSGSSDLVTSADLASQKLIFQSLSATYPNDRLIGEEDEQHYEHLDNRPTWIVDAIDGTTNYVHGFTDFSVSIGFSYNCRVQTGAVYNPNTKEMFTAVRGVGAFLNDKPISVSRCARLENALIISEWGYDRTEEGVEKMLKVNHRFMTKPVRGIRQLGSGSLDMCYVAMGKVEATYCGVSMGDSWKIWDYAAASVIAEEAGAELRTVNGEKFEITDNSMVCSAPGVLDDVLGVIQGK